MVRCMSQAESSVRLCLVASAGHPLHPLSLGDNVSVLMQLWKRPSLNLVDRLQNEVPSPAQCHIRTLTFGPSFLPSLCCGDSTRGLMHQMHISLITGVLHR